MPVDEVNYFGSDPVLPKSVRRESGEQVDAFDNPGDEQLRFDEACAVGQGSALKSSYTRAGVPRGAWVEVSLGAIEHNTKLARKAIGSRCQLMAVVKADAYGHGAVQVALTALAAGADRLGVATVEEGVELREAGINAPILVLAQPPLRTIPLLLRFSLTPAVCDTDFALALGEAADKCGKVAAFHLAVNSGMNRIGVFYLDVVDFIRSIDFHRGLKYEGTFTHFATADCETDWDFRIQVRRFEEALALLREAGISPGIVHAANSASIFRYPEVHYDMCRLGICLYGLPSSAETANLAPLKPAMSVKAQVSFVQEPQLGEGVSYGMNYRVAKPVQIATLPLGYADGVRRCLTDAGFRVLCNGRLCRQVGNICMDQMMIEVPLGHSITGQAGGAEVGDEVVIIGEQGDYELTVETMAEALGTINHEVTCLFGLRLPRVYV